MTRARRRRWLSRPGRESGLRSSNSLVQLRATCQRDLCLHVTRGGVVNVTETARFTSYLLTANPVRNLTQLRALRAFDLGCYYRR